MRKAKRSELGLTKASRSVGLTNARDRLGGIAMLRVGVIILAVALLGSAAPAITTTYTLPGGATGTWETPSPAWTRSGGDAAAGLTAPNRAGDTALTSSTTASTLTLDITAGGTVTIGQLAKVNSGALTINAGSGGTAATLVMDNTGGSQNLFLTGNAAIENGATNNLTIGAAIALKNTDLDIGSSGGSGNIVINGNITNVGNTADATATHTINIRTSSGTAGSNISFAGNIGATGSNLAFVNQANLGGNAYTVTVSGVLGPKVTSVSQLNALSPMTLMGTNTYTGTTNVGTVGSGANGGTLIVSGANGAINSTSAVFITGVSAGGTTSKLNLDNSTSVAERINNSATVTTSLGGEFVLTNNATTKTVETIGGLTIGAGTSTITLSGGGTTLLHELVVGSSGFTRTDNGTALIRGIAYNSAAASVSLLSVDKTNISGGGTGLTLIGTNISSVGYKGNTATSASTRNLKIVPYLLATYSATGSGFGFLTYDTNATTGGLRLLSSFEIQSLNSTTSSYNASGENVAIAGNTTFANPGSLTFNSLNMSATAALNAKSTSDTLTITSGAVMALGATTSIGTFDKLNLDNGEGVFLVGDGVTFTVSSRVDVTSGGTHSVSGGITKGGNGALVLNAANLFTGPIIINSGSVKYGVSGSLQATNTVATASGAVFDISAKSPTLAGMNNVGGTGGTVTNTSTATASTLTLGGSGAYDFAGVITATTVANMALNVALTGNGSQSLSGSSTYTGATAVSSGKLFVNGSLSASSAVSVASGATLGGGGSVGAVTVTGPGSVIAPGAANASGKLTVSSLTAATGTHMQFQVGATSGTPNSDQLAVTGAFAGTTATDSQDIVIDLEVVGSGPVAGATYTLITFGSSSSLTAGDFALGSHDGLTLSTTGFDTDGVLDGIFFDSANKQVQVQFSAVPEPTSLSLIGGVVAGLLVRRRRKQ